MESRLVRVEVVGGPRDGEVAVLPVNVDADPRVMAIDHHGVMVFMDVRRAYSGQGWRWVAYWPRMVPDAG